MASDPLILNLSERTFSIARIPLSTTWLLAECMEFRGKQILWERQTPELLQALREQATIQSVESSNRIEGVTVAPERLRPLVLGKSKPKDRPEEELAGYRKALHWIFAQGIKKPVDPSVIRHLHALCQHGAGDAGEFKRKDNEIIEFNSRGERTVRFRPTSAADTPRALKSLTMALEELTLGSRVPPLLMVATAVFDFLCIHPFRDGNGRVSRLLTTLLLERYGFIVCRYVSLERLIEESKADYYAILKQSSDGWHDGRNDLMPWWNYFLGIVRRAYVEFSVRMESAGSWGGKADRVRQVILATADAFTLADLRPRLPGISTPMIKKVLQDLQREKKVTLHGRGRGARWQTRPS